MNFEIRGRKAIVSAASKGLGRACAFSLAREGVDLVIMARSAGPLAETAAQIRAETKVDVSDIPGDFNSDEGRAALLEACPDILILVGEEMERFRGIPHLEEGKPFLKGLFRLFPAGVAFFHGSRTEGEF